MSIFDRSQLAKAFPDQPRLRADLETLGQSFEDAQQQVADIIESATAMKAQLQALVDATPQPHSALLDEISAVPDSDLGVFEKTAQDEVTLREVDSADDACLVSRSNLMSYVGKGTTANRPTLSAKHRAIYFDTTLAADGKPIFWTGAAWVDSTGTVV